MTRFLYKNRWYELVPAVHDLHFGKCNVVTVDQGKRHGHLVMTTDERVLSDHPHQGNWRLIVGLPEIFTIAAKAMIARTA